MEEEEMEGDKIRTEEDEKGRERVKRGERKKDKV